MPHYDIDEEMAEAIIAADAVCWNAGIWDSIDRDIDYRQIPAKGREFLAKLRSNYPQLAAKYPLSEHGEMF